MDVRRSTALGGSSEGSVEKISVDIDARYLPSGPDPFSQSKNVVTNAAAHIQAVATFAYGDRGYGLADRGTSQ